MISWNSAVTILTDIVVTRCSYTNDNTSRVSSVSFTNATSGPKEKKRLAITSVLPARPRESSSICPVRLDPICPARETQLDLRTDASCNGTKTRLVSIGLLYRNARTRLITKMLLVRDRIVMMRWPNVRLG